jgi:phosphoglycerate kinase
LLGEINALNSVLENPKRPTAAVIGGAKVSSKIPVLKNLAAKVDTLIVGGGMANTFLLAQGCKIGKSMAEPDLAQTALEIIGAAKERRCQVLLPDDVVVAERLAAGATARTVPVLETPADQMILDVGPKTVARYSDAIEGAKTLLWNGPLGAFEVEPFARGTIALARAVAKLTKAGRLVSVAGGGDTVAALNAAGVTEDFSYVSTAGGAFLEWLEGRELPGIVALAQARS